MRALVRVWVEHGTTVFLAVLCLFVAGLASYVSLPRESNPDITIPVVLVSTPYGGVAPEDVEGLITIPLENELAGLRDVKEMRSTSSEGVSIISIEFEPNVVIEDALQKVRDAVSKARPNLPDDAEEPSVREISFSDIPVVLVTIAGDTDEGVLKGLADDLQEAVTRIPGVLDARVSGGLEREIAVEVYPERLAHYGLALYDVVNAIRDENVNIPGGTVASGSSSVLLRVPGEFASVDDLGGVAIKRVGDRPVFVRDVARVVDGTAPRTTYSRMNGQPAVTLSVTKRAGANILEVARQVKALAAAHAERWPDGVHHRILGDQSESIEISVTDLQNNIVTALVLVVGVIVVFMGWRSSLFVALAIPLSMLASFLVLDLLGFTLNMVVLFSLMIALGMLVDNAIVVVENVYRHVEAGRSPLEAAIEGTAEVGIAVGASTATTVAAFFPMVFWPGIMGEFMSFLPKTVIIVLTASLVVAVLVLPVFMARSLRRGGSGPPVPAPSPAEAPTGRVMRLYRSVLELSIRFRYLSLAAGLFALFATFVAYAFLNHGVEIFPDTEPERANIFVLAPEGTELDTTDRIVRRIEAILARHPNVDVWVAETGVVSDGNALGPSSTAPNQARITVDFRPSVNTARPGEPIRVEPTSRTIEALRAELKQLVGAEIRIEKERMGPPVGKPIVIQVRGPDFHGAGELALQLRRAIQEIEGITDLSDDYRVGRPELPIRVDRGAAKRVGVSTALVGDTLRTAVAGTRASALRDGEEEYPIVVRLVPEARDDLQQILALRLPGREDRSPSTFPVPLSAVASATLAGGTGAIRHVDQDLVVTIEGDVTEGTNAVAVQERVAALLERWPTPEGYRLQLAGSRNEQDEAQAFLLRAFLIACASILLVLVTQFDSVWLPVIILVTVALSLIGVLWGLVITGTPFGIIMTGIGVISLAGVVVNNAIVLLDYVEQLQARGATVRESLLRAGVTRFRPVMLTAITTTLGLIPMAIGVSVDFMRLRLVVGSTSAQWWGPMAVAVIFGLSFATVLTLVMVPTLYSIYDDLRRLGRRLWASAPVAGLLLVSIAVPGSARSATLSDAWMAAERHNVDVQLLEERTFQAGLQRYKALAALSPRLTVSGSRVINAFEIAVDFTEGLPELPGFDIDVEPVIIQRKAFWMADLTLSQRLFSGSAFPALRSAVAHHRSARLEALHRREQIRLGIAETYYATLVAREAVQLAEASLASARGHLERVEREGGAGIATRRHRLQAELELARAERTLRTAEQGRARAEERLHKLTGLPRDEPLEIPEIPVLPPMSDLLGRLRARPDIRAATEQIRAASLRTLSSRLRWLPTIDAQFHTSYNQNTGFQDDPTSWTLAVVGRWELWDGGLRLAESAEYASQTRMARLRLRQREDDAKEELRLAWETYRTAEIALEDLGREVDLAEENLRLAEESLAVGAATWLELRQARTALSAARLEQLQRRADRDLAALAVRFAAGLSLDP